MRKQQVTKSNPLPTNRSAATPSCSTAELVAPYGASSTVLAPQKGLTAPLFSGEWSMCASAGFTFVETLIAVSILLLAVAAPLTLASQSLAASRIARDQVIATYLAQEAIEHARNIRDTNILGGSGWLTDLEACIDSSCALDIPAGDIASCANKGACGPLTFDEETGFYGMSESKGVVTTKYTRILMVEMDEDNTSEARLTALVTWKDGLADCSVTVEESIFDWQ